mgnify:CR=1 FL=1
MWGPCSIPSVHVSQLVIWLLEITSGFLVGTFFRHKDHTPPPPKKKKKKTKKHTHKKNHAKSPKQKQTHNNNTTTTAPYICANKNDLFIHCS